MHHGATLVAEGRAGIGLWGELVRLLGRLHPKAQSVILLLQPHNGMSNLSLLLLVSSGTRKSNVLVALLVHDKVAD